MKFSHQAGVLSFIVVMLGLGTVRIYGLEAKNELLEQQLRETLLRQSPAPMLVTCVCPDYEEGWNDAEHASGCDPEELGLETLRTMCAEFDTYGYVPHC